MAILGVVASLQCASLAEPPTLTRCQQAAELRRTIYPNGTSTQAEEADLASRFIPGGFGGLWMDVERRVLVVGLVDLAQQTRASASLDSLLACNAIYPGQLGGRLVADAKEFRQVRFTGQQLQSWLTQIVSLAPGRSWAQEVDPLQNQLWIGVSTVADRDAIVETVSRSGIPSTGIAIELPPSDSAAGAFQVVSREISVFVLADQGYVFHVVVEHINNRTAAEFQDRCAAQARSEPLSRLEKWEGGNWRTVYRPICDAILLDRVLVAPGAARRDTVGVFASLRTTAVPRWDNVRVNGTYRLVASLYRAAFKNPPDPDDQLPDSLGRSQTFHLLYPAQAGQPGAASH